MNTVDAAHPTKTYGRLNVILAAVLVIQALLTAFVYWPRPAAGGDNQPLLGDLAADAVTGVTITDNSGRTVALERTADGWTLAGTDGYPAKETKITETLDKLLAITANRQVTTQAASHRRLQVAEDEYQRKVEVATDSGVHTLFLGSSAGAAATHVRAAGEDATYLTGAIAAWELDTAVSGWIDAAYFSAPAADIVRLTVQNANGTLTFVRDDNDEWTLSDLAAGEEVLPNNITTLVNRVAFLNLQTVLGKSEQPEYGLAEPQATVEVTVKGEDGGETTTTFVVGAKNTDSNTYYFKSSASPYYVLLAAYTGDEFVQKQRSDFLAQPDEAKGADPAGEGAAQATPAAP